MTPKEKALEIFNKMCNSVDELLLKDFEYITSIFNDKEKQHFEKWSEIFVFLGLPEDVVDEFDTFAFIDIIKEFNIFVNTLFSLFDFAKNLLSICSFLLNFL